MPELIDEMEAVITGPLLFRRMKQELRLQLLRLKSKENFYIRNCLCQFGHGSVIWFYAVVGGNRSSTGMLQPGRAGSAFAISTRRKMIGVSG